MRSGIILIFCFLSISLIAQRHRSSPLEQLKTEIPKIIFHDTDITYDKTPGFIVGIIDGDSTYIIPFGSKELDGEEDIKPDDRFCLAGNTKVFTGLLIRILEEKGVLSVEDNLNDFLDKKWQNEAFSNISIADLLSHHSGLPKIPPGIGQKEIDGNLFGNYTRFDFLNFYKDYKPLHKENATYNYSHLNYGLIEIALENRLQMAFEDIMLKYLIHPMGLFSIDFLKKDDRRTIGYNLSMKETSSIPYASNNGSLGLVGSMNDLLKFMRISLGSEESFHDSIRKSIQPINGPTYTSYMHMASGWQIMEIKKMRNLYFHNGKTMGHHSFIAFYPSTKTAVVVLANSEYGTEDLGLLIMRMLNRKWKRKK